MYRGEAIPGVFAGLKNGKHLAISSGRRA